MLHKMKTLLILFVLFFSSSLLAEDDLSDISIVCGEVIEDQKYQIQGYEFLKDNNFVYHEFVGGKFWNLPLGELIYKTDLLYIYISRQKSIQFQTFRQQMRSVGMRPDRKGETAWKPL